MRFWASLFAAFLAACLAFSVVPACAVGSGEAAAAVSNADGTLRGAFVAVLDAENAGANVSGLMERLNNAGAALTMARVALAAGNYSVAVSMAGECRGLADGVLNDAGLLEADAVAQASLSWVTLLLSVVGSVVFVAALFVVWRRFKRFHRGKFLRSRPEVRG